MSTLRCSCSGLLRSPKRWRSTSFCVWRSERTALHSRSSPVAVSACSSREDERKPVGGGEEGGWLRRVLYSSVLQRRPEERRSARKAFARIDKENERLVKTWTSLPVVAASFLQQTEVEGKEREVRNSSEASSQALPQPAQPSAVHFPYKVTTSFERKTEDDVGTEMKNKFVSEAEKLERMGIDAESLVKRAMGDDAEEMNRIVFEEMGTPNPKIRASDVPCGGCGAHLHCQDVSVPGYMPSERFKLLARSTSDDLLRGEVCLRCYGLKEYNTALNVNVSAEDYPELLKVIKGKFALVVLMVDLTDFPCSIWPGIIDIIGEKRPVILVGNKVDLLPRDSEKFLNHIKRCLISVAEEAGLRRAKIFDTALISAATGFGVEELITSIYRWGMKGDVYIMGCTNVGKSSLFNKLIQSDMCKTHVVDLVQRATVSQWPGTTLNLLKFPVHRADAWRLAERNMRLKSDARIHKAEAKHMNMLLRMTKEPQYATLMGHVGRTFLSREKAEAATSAVKQFDPYSLKFNPAQPSFEPQLGQWDPNDHDLKGHWCFDTPGVVHENQILDKLTLPELMKTLPKKLIEPRTYFIKVGMSFFIGGLARIDYVEGTKPIRYTLFSSDELPVTITFTEDADEVYKKGLGTTVFRVPEGNQDRLNVFPQLLPNEFAFDGLGHNHSCADLVFSSAGWVAVTIGSNQSSVLKVWTPNGKGLFCRLPALLPFAVNMKGPRIRDTPAYGPHRVFISNQLT